jgi:Cu2+-exporting ATPase
MPGARSNLDDELLLASRRIAEDVRQSELTVPSMHCGACIQRVERVLGRLPGVERARANLSTKRVTIDWRGDRPPPLVEALDEAGFEAHLGDTGRAEADGGVKELVRALAVAGFAAGNIMMLSVGVWSGADPGARDLLHWLSAAIALPCLAYSGRIFFRSAWRAVSHGRTNMDVPISIGVLLAFGMSLYETAVHAEHAYFDAAASLLFFLLIGRTLDHVMRERARTVVKNLARLGARGASVVEGSGVRYRQIDEITPGMTIRLAPGERVPVDARVGEGRSDLDVSLVSGESLPRPVGAGDALQAGTLNLTGTLTIVATAAARESFLAEMMRLMERAETGRASYRRIADRAARLYAPVVHLTAFLTFVGWMVAAGDLHRAITVAIAVLIVTCPCALGLAVPMVQVVAVQRLLQRGILVKDGGALERLAEADWVAFDKTGTLTEAVPTPADEGYDPPMLALAAGIARHSRHPYAQAIAVAGRRRGLPDVAAAHVTEHAGCGIEAEIGGRLYRLGRADWAAGVVRQPGVVLAEKGRVIGAFHFDEALRPGAEETVAAFQAVGVPVEILSGDDEGAVRRLASRLGVPYVGGVSPQGKMARLAALAVEGRKVLMVGDGLNDAPSLVAAHVSMAPASAADIGRNAADIILLRENLGAAKEAFDTARRADRLVRQNLALAIGYNLLAVLVAILGLATPLIAAIAMSASSIVVVANALRLARRPMRAA